MKSWIFLSVLLLGFQVSAQESRMLLKPKIPEFSQVGIHPLNVDYRFERGSSQNIEARSAQNFALSYTGTRGSLLVEYAQFNDRTGNSTSAIERRYQDMSLWARYHFFQAGSVKECNSFRLFTGLGLGGYNEEVQTTLMGETRTDAASLKLMTGITAGAELVLYTRYNFGFSLATEARGFFASDFNPNPTWSGVLRLGLIFPL